MTPWNASRDRESSYWSDLSDEADRLTEANRAEAEHQALTDRETGIAAMEAFLENQSMHDIAALLWDERQHEIEELKSVQFPGVADRTQLARWFKDAAKQYAEDTAERVDADDLADRAAEDNDEPTESDE